MSVTLPMMMPMGALLLVVGVDDVHHALLGLEVLGVDLDRRRVVRRGVAERLEVVVVGELARVSVALHEGGEVLGVHVEADGPCQGVRVHTEGALELGETAGHLVGILGEHLRHGALELGRNGSANLRGHALHEGLQVRGELARDVVGHDLLDALAHGGAGNLLDLGEDALGVLGLEVGRKALGELLDEVRVLRVERANVSHEAHRELAAEFGDLLELLGREGGVGELLL